MGKHTEVKVEVIPSCDFCTDPAVVDGKTNMGPWANMCSAHYVQHGVGLGLGRGQRLVLNPPKLKSLREIPAHWIGTC